MSDVTVTLTKAQAETLRYLLDVHTGPIPRYQWTKRDCEIAERVIVKLDEAQAEAVTA